MDPLSQGRELYYKKDYKQALLAFNQAVKICTDHLLVTALDHRAATYEKLNELKPALRDASQMIKIKPELAKGYLRCAKLLHLKGDDELALKIYERGLNKVKIGTDEDRVLLQRQYNKLKSRQEPSKNFDPLVMLPAELAQMVISCLRMRDLVVCLSVSRQWKQFLESCHDLWTTLDTGTGKNRISKQSLKAHFKRSKYGLLRAIIDSADFDASKFAYMIRVCTQLEYLEIRASIVGDSLKNALPMADSLRSLILGPKCSLSLETAVKVLMCRPHLTTARFCNINLGRGHYFVSQWPQMDKLQILEFSTHMPLPASEILQLKLSDMIKCTPNVRSATIIGWRTSRWEDEMYDFSLWTKLELLNLHSCYLLRVPLFPTTLKYLDMSSVTHMQTENPVHPNSGPNSLTSLEFFSCDHCLTLTPKTAIMLVDQVLKRGVLTSLNIGRLGSDIEPLTADDFPMSEALERLSLAHLRVAESVIISIIQRYPNVQYVELSGTKITGVAVKALMMRISGPPKWLGLKECSHLSHDAIEYAQSLGTVVEFLKDVPGRHHPMSYKDKVAMSGL